MKKAALLLVSLLVSWIVNAQEVPNPYASIGKPAPRMASLTNGAFEEYFVKDSLVLIDGDAVNRKTGELVYSKENNPDKIAALQKKEEDRFRFLSVDPLTKQFAQLTPYQFASNSPIANIDLDGKEAYWFQISHDEKTGEVQIKLADIKTSYLDRVMPYSMVVSTDGADYKYSGSYWSHEEMYKYLAKIATNPEPFYAELKKGQEQNYEDHEKDKQDWENIWTSAFALAWASKTKKGTYTDQESTSKNSGITLKNSAAQDGPGFVSYSTNIENGKININGRAVTNGTFDYVITNEGKLVVGTGHYNLSGGATSVKAVGQLKLYKGQVTGINNNSGHYLPSVSEGEASIKELNNIGVSTSGANVKLYNSEGTVEKSFKAE